MKYFELLLTFIFLFSCSIVQKKDIDLITDEFSIDDLVEIKLEQFELSDEIKMMIDTIICLTVNCNKYKNLPLGFVFESHKDSLDSYKIHIGSFIELEKLNYIRCTGLFYYKGYKFLYIGDILDTYFTTLNRTKKNFFVSQDKIESIELSYGEFFNSSWDYILKKGEFYCYHYNYCNDFWYDSTYYQGVD